MIGMTSSVFRICTLLVVGPLAAACATTGAVPSPFPVPGDPPARRPAPSGVPADPLPAGSPGEALAGTALALRGVPYRNGGSDPAGFDCSGFVWYVLGRHGLALPRTVAEQFNAGEPIAVDRLEPGDLVFFRTEGRAVSHVGMSIGGDAFVHAPSERGEVRVERLGSSYWWPRFAGARRIR